MDISVNKMFRTNLFIRTFRELFNVTPRNEAGDPIGPLAIILRNYPLTIAKGGSKHKEFPDQTYFTHIVNGLVLGGRMLENELLDTFGTEEKLPNNIAEWVRLYFAAFTLHDINKLETNKTLINTKRNRQELEKIASYMKFSDRIGSIKSTSSLHIYQEINKIFEDFTKES